MSRNSRRLIEKYIEICKKLSNFLTSYYHPKSILKITKYHPRRIFIATFYHLEKKIFLFLKKFFKNIILSYLSDRFP